MFDGYTARNIAMFWYPMFALFFYRHWQWHKFTPYIAVTLFVFIILTGTWIKFIDRTCSVTEAMEIYQQKKNIEKDIVYVPKVIKPQAYCPNEIYRAMGGDHVPNMVFRVLIWQDMISELIKNRAWFGMGLSHPLRSPQIEKLDWAEGEWSRDGWISAHNSYLYVIYRTGILGFAAICWLFFALYGCIRNFLREVDIIGLLLLACLGYWMLEAFFQEQWQLPYYAIPFWCLFGLIMNYKKWRNNAGEALL